MQYTSNYHLSKPDSDDIINPNSRAGYNGNFDTIDTNLKSVSNKANTNENNIATLQSDVIDLNAKTGDDIPFESGSADSISDKISTLSNFVGDLSTLDTTDKTSLVNAINEEDGKIDILSNYSTSEQVIGTWINGKPLYRKCFLRTEAGSFDHGISDFKEVVRLRGMGKDNSSYFPIPYYYNNTIACTCYINPTQIVISSSGLGTSWYFFIVEYTKTTD